MEFLNFEKIIRDNYPILVESYVEQYGEKYRKHIVSTLNRMKYCFFVTPSDLVEYVSQKVNEDYMRAIINSYLELGVDISAIGVDEEGFTFENDHIGALTKALFPHLDDVKELYLSGIFAFSDDYDDVDINDPVFKERIEMLEKLNLKDPNLAVEEYVKSDNYAKYVKTFKKVLKIVQANINKYCDNNYDEFLNYADELESKIAESTYKYQREFFLKIKDYLCEEDREKLESDDNYDYRKLRDYPLYFEDELEDDETYSFSDGYLDYFLDAYTDMLLDPEVSQYEKEEIVEKRFKYLNRLGIDTSRFNIKKFFCDWKDLGFFNGLLPSQEFLKPIMDIKDDIYTRYTHEIATLCIINDYELGIDDVEIDTIIDADGHSCSIDRNDVINTDSPICIACLCPFTDTYNLFDIAIDHELRHAIETSIRFDGEKFFLKVGVDNNIFFADKDKNDIISSEFSNYNERVTQKLSVEATKKRWEKGQFIFSDWLALLTKYPLSVYDYDLDNLNIIFEPFRARLVEAQISPDSDLIFKTIPRNKLSKISQVVILHNKKTTSFLKKTAKDIERRLDSEEKIKSKKIKFKQ